MSTRSGLATECEAIYREAVAELSAARLVAHALSAPGSLAGAVRVLAMGKAAAAMMASALAVLGPRARDPLCILPEGEPPPAGATAVHGTHPKPGPGSLAAGAAVLEWAERGRGEAALVLVSGGASALAFLPAAGVSAADKTSAVARLMAAGLTIGELNCVRKHLSRIKGGRLARVLAPAPVLVLVLSDVPGDDLSSIASGPLVADPTRYDEALRIIEASGTAGEMPPAVLDHLRRGARGELDETPKPGDPAVAHVVHRLLAGPMDLARSAAAAARRRGFAAEVRPGPVTGDVAAVAGEFLGWARARAGARRLLAAVGEPTIRIPAGAAAPDGGRDQHLALMVAQGLAGTKAAFLAAGSDGRDGPTEQAGAAVDGGTMDRARSIALDVAAALGEARSGPAARALGTAIPRFLTGTHLCDLFLVAVDS